MILAIPSKSLVRSICAQISFKSHGKPKSEVINQAHLLGMSGLQNTMSMSHSKTNSKDSSILINNQPSLLKVSDSNFNQPKCNLFSQQWVLSLFNHKVSF